MASLKDLIVTGATRLIGDAYVNKIQITAISAPTASNGTTYSTGSSGQVLKSNGTSIYWAADDNSQTVTGVKGNSESSYRTGNVNITAANIGLGNVENTKLSTWTGSSNITTIGTLSSGTVPWARLSNVPAGASKEGTVTSITPGNGLLNGTGTSAITSTGTLNINYGTTTAKIGTAAAGSATTVSRSDHVHAIDLATGDSNGQVKIAGTNVSVKGLGSNAYTSTAYAPLASPALTGTPTAPTAAAGTNTTQIATTAFVKNAIATNGDYIPKNTVGNTQQLLRPLQLNGLNDVTLDAKINDLRANRLAFLPADQIIIEKTTDGGTTWTDAGVSNWTKVSLFSETRPAVYIPLLNNAKNINCGLRITFTAMKYNVPSGTAETQKYNYWNSNYIVSTERYNQLKEMYFWVSANSDTISVKAERATGANSTTWIKLYDSDENSYGMTGWSGNDYIRFSQGVFGGGTTQTGNYWNYRLTFFTRGPGGSKTTLSGTNTSSAQSISEIRGYGDTYWTAGNNYAAHDHLYSHDASQNVTFPAQITATAFNGNASTATKATQDESGNNIKASYASSFSISDHTITLKNKNGDSLGTITVPDNNDKVTQAYSTTNANYPLLLTATSGVSSTSSRGDTTSILNNTIYGNPNKGMLYSKGLTVSSDTDLTLYSNTIRLRNLNNDNNQAGTNPWITSLNLGDKKYVTLTEYKDDHVALRGSSILLTTETAYEVYDPTSSYTVGKVVWYNKAYYRCTTAIPEGGEAWDSTHWASMPAANVMVNSHLVPWYTNDKTLGTSSYRWKAAYIGTANTYGSSSQPIYWNAGVPTAIDYTIAKSVPADAKFTDTTYGIATNTTNGLVKPWYTHTAASTGPTTGNNATAVTVNAISTTAGKYYAVEADNNGRLFVNVPWTNVNNSYVTSSGVTSITLSSGTGISVSDSGTAITSTGSRTIGLASISGLTTGTYGPTGSNTTLTPSHGGTFTVPTFSIDTYGRITSASNYTVKLPSDADIKVKQTVSSTNANYKLLFTTTASPTSGTAYETYYDSAITVNPSTDTITATTFVGKMSKGITIGGKTYNGSSDITINSSDLGLTSPMTFKGVSTTNLSDGATTSPITLKSGSSLTPSEGDVVLDATDNEEYIWSGSKWNAMGIASSYAMAQHTHGNIANDGSLGSDVTIANGDKIVVTDASDSNKISRASISFNGSTTTKALSQKGTWESFLPISGGTLTGNVTLNKMTGSSANYGDELPATGTEGQIFFKVGGVESKVDSFYPVGSIYMSVSSANPGTLFGGTWERIQDCFLLGAGPSYSAGTTGGEATHTLTIDEMPNHSHSIYGGNNTDPSDWFGGSGNAYGIQNKVGSAYRYLEYVGGDAAHNNMPPYLAVYMWKRIA